ncbi:hypothetical protein MYOV065v1_p0058 [Vibrio phage PS15B.2]|nr:hypothetical protein MYOV065v1_p0058 [Vibrio phage PS15B.2]QZI90803.1 hypothetical protein MYOV066v1_p0025 [Vibrio phage PS15B.3]QZI90909.1 hypothetical protein MYOV064v1_p0059 [Vibrio phage PS15B.4]
MANDWIDIKESHPELFDNIIVHTESGAIFQAMVWSEGEICSTFSMGKDSVNAKPSTDVTHWMPLPEAPDGWD